ncbi:hypothetical protein ASPBRDRAFT_200631 [Aspergillus brasiliensis CBS 101740]|uniref:Transcription factor domain-containing protein n=1 Tax=Aspergillus brasiliensis (strain CBS 101740 / IMI 381727 / IBT 21946) TaxID=767769 RepID=A0A1L9U5S5_ASPBC|nr:hypothetical protein ASPBRDRAFT_200631 [Aspergillus brasiliensis CBS 101740]
MDPPIGYRSYMSPLLEFFLTSIALPSDTAGTNSLSHHLRSEWMKHAMTDPCLFHATLFSASASIDMLRGQHNTAVALYHQTWAIRLLNERLAQPEPVLTYATLGAVIPLLYYNMVALDQDSAVTHQRGLVKMLLATPKSVRNDIGPLIAIVKIAMLSFACIYGMQPTWDCLDSESVRPNSLLRNVVSRVALGTGRSVFQKQIMDGILDVYEEVSRLEHCSNTHEEFERAHPLATSDLTIPLSENIHDRLTPSERLNACCSLSCHIFWKALRGRRQRQSPGEQNPSPTDQDRLIRELLHCLLQVEPLYWIRNAPEAFTWAAFTGAAASSQPDLRATFINHAATVITAIDGEDLTLIRQGWRYFGLVKGLGGE